MVLADLAGPVVVLAVAGTCLYPVTETNSSRGKVLVSVAAAGLGGLALCPPLMRGSVLDLPLAMMLLVLVVPTLWRGSAWPHSVIPTDHDGDQLIGTVTYLGLAWIASRVAHPWPAIVVLPLIGVALSGTMYYQFYARMSGGADRRFTLKHMRLQGTMTNPLFGGGVLATLVVLALSLHQWWAVGAMLPALFWTRSRGAYLAACVGTVIVTGPVGWVVGGVGTAAVVAIDPRFRWHNLVYELSTGRAWVYQTALRMVRMNPWLGYGQNQFRLKAKDSNNFHMTPHNGLLYVAHAWGVPGVLAYLTVIGVGLWHASPVILPALVTYLVFEQTAWPYYGSATAFWALLGLGVAR